VNKQIEKELLQVKAFSSLEDAAIGIGEWIDFYNFERVHMCDSINYSDHKFLDCVDLVN
jgi:hypothetical protein